MWLYWGQEKEIVQERMIKEMKFMTAANHYTSAESERRGAAGSRLPMTRFFGRMTAELTESKVVLLVWGAFCTMLTVSSAIDPLGGEMVRQDRSVPVVTGNTFIKE